MSRAHLGIRGASVWLTWFSVCLLFPTTAGNLAAGENPEVVCPDNPALAARLKRLADAHPETVRIRSLARTLGSNDVWCVEMGRGAAESRATRPALLVVAGIEGHDLFGTACTLAWADQLVLGDKNDQAIRRLLESTTVYLFPRLNPDAAAGFFATPKVEILGNRRPVDDDHDGLRDEDGPEDLDGDGLITGMRLRDPEGEYILDPAEPRLLLKTDKSKGEKGAWRLLTEGRDNDGDEAWNEDGPGGVNLNRNFPYNYRFFAADSGPHQVSEFETRALADFIVQHPHIGVVFTFGAADNLVQAPGSEPRSDAPAESAGPGSRERRPAAGMNREDVPFYRELGRLYRESLGLKTELTAASEPGTFSDWMYYHRGRCSLAARPWSPALQLELAKSKASPTNKTAAAKTEDAGTPDRKPAAKPSAAAGDDQLGSASKPGDDKRNESDRAFLKWLDTNAPSMFVPWRTFPHPDFPGKKVEIGGWAPFAKVMPPESLQPGLASSHGRFLTTLAGKLPRLGIRQVRVKALGNEIFEVTAEIENTGYLPTMMAHGQTTGEVLPTRVTLDGEIKNLLAGVRRTQLGPLEGSGGMKEVRWILHAQNGANLKIRAVSALAGTVEKTVELKEENPDR